MTNSDPDVLTLLQDRTEGDFAASNGAQVTMRALGERALPGLIEAVERTDVPLPHQWEAVNALAEIGAAAVEGLIVVLMPRTLPSNSGGLPEKRLATLAPLGSLQRLRCCVRWLIPIRRRGGLLLMR